MTGPPVNWRLGDPWGEQIRVIVRDLRVLRGEILCSIGL